MTAMLLLSLCISIGLAVLSLILKVAGKLRLTIPVLHLLIVSFSTPFNGWVSQHEKLVMAGFYFLLAAVILSWIVTLVRTIRHRRFMEEDMIWQIHRAREQGVPMDGITFDENGSLIDPRTGEPVIYGTDH